MDGRYAISLFDRETIPLIKNILGDKEEVEMVIILCASNRRIEEELIDFSRKFGIKTEIVPIYDFNNFYEVYLMLEKICEAYGPPCLVNIASGYGMALSALTLHAYFKDAPLVMFDKEKNAIVKTDVNRLKKSTCIAQPNPHISFLRILSISTNMLKPFNLHVDNRDAIYW